MGHGARTPLPQTMPAARSRSGSVPSRQTAPRAASMLNADTVHVWYALSDLVDDQRVLERYAAMMSSEERSRRDRFVRAVDRHQFLITRGMLRTLLACYLETEPAELVFRIDRYGRPALSRPGCNIEFNVSHTRGLIVCAFARVPEIGVDVEDIDRGAVSP